MRPRKGKARRGQALVEFALVLPVFLLLIFGIVDAGRLIYTYNTVANAAREGARVAIVNQSDAGTKTCDTESATAWPTGCAIAAGITLGLKDSDVVVEYREADDSGNCVPIKIGCVVSVAVTGTYTALTPVIGQLIGTIDVTSTTEMPMSAPVRTPPPPQSPIAEDDPRMFMIERHDGERGQVLAIFVGGLFALILGVAVVIDGGNAMAQQRSSQNGADAAAEAGTVVVAQYLMGGSSATGAIGPCPAGTVDPWDLEVCKAVYGSAAANERRRRHGRVRGLQGGHVGCGRRWVHASGSQGVRVNATREFGTYFARVVGMNTIKASTARRR